MSGNELGLAVQNVDSGTGVSRERVDGAEEEVLTDVVEVTTETQPWTGGRNVVGGALALSF